MKPQRLIVEFESAAALQAFIACHDLEDGKVSCTPAPTPTAPPIVAIDVVSGVFDTDIWHFDLTGTSDPEGALSSVSVDWGDGSPDTVVGLSGGAIVNPEVSHEFPAGADTYTITVTAVDSSGLSHTATIQIDVDVVAIPNEAPIAALTFVSGEFTGSPVTVSTAGTTDPDGTIASYEMDWDDGAPVTGATPPPATLQHTYATPGTYTAVLTVTDDDAAEGSVEMEIIVAAPAPGDPPTASVSLSSGEFLGDTFVFAIDGSDPDAGPITWSLNYGDGSAAVTGDGDDLPTTRSRVYAAVGNYTAVFRVTDAESLTTTATASVTVVASPGPDPDPENQSPIARLAFVSGQFVGDTFVFNTDGTVDLDGSFASWSVDWDDPTPNGGASGVPPASLTHIYNAAGTYTVTFTVTDTGSPAKSGVATLTVIVEAIPPDPDPPPTNRPPTATLIKSGGSILGDTFTFALTGADPEGGAIRWELNFGDGSALVTGTTLPTTRTRVYTAVGTYTVRLKVSDPSNLTTTVTLSVTVFAVPDPGDPGDHDYFNALIQRPERVGSWGLRSQSELNSLVADDVSGKIFTDSLGVQYQAGFNYNPLTDTFPDAQDAARFLVNPHTNAAGVLKNNVPISQQLQFNWGTALFPPGSRCVVVWDFWWGEDFRTNRGGTTAWKTWMVTTHSKKRTWTLVDNLGKPTDPAGATTRHDECGVGMGAGPYSDTTGDGFAGVDGVVYPSYPNGLGRAEGIAAVGPSAGPSAPIQRPFGAPYGVIADHTCWTRYIIEIGVGLPASAFTAWNAGLGVTVQDNPNDSTGQGRWNMLSVFVLSAARGIQRSLFRCPIGANMQLWTPNVDGFRAEMNTSKSNPAGDFHGYMRDVVVLKNFSLGDTDPEANTTLFSLDGL